jgi:hypothetical protein
MRLAQRFALDNIYCAPGQDKQFSFRMTRMNKMHLPPKGRVLVHNTTKHLPSTQHNYHVFSIGGIPPQILNLLTQQEGWFRDSWIRVSEDMVARNFLMKIYSEDGLVYPSQHVYYSFTDQNSLIVALEITTALRSQFPVDTFRFMHVYSNAYFNTLRFNALAVKTGIAYRCAVVNNNLHKVQLQTFIQTHKANGGDVYVYVNGHYTRQVNLNIPDGSLVEVVYDQSVRSVEQFALNSLRTFQSTLDSKTKYLLYRTDYKDFIQYQDDTELYVMCESALVSKGVYFYKHSSDVMRNVSDKDYSVNAAYVNNTSVRLGELSVPGTQDKSLVMYSRHSGREMPLVYSALKLHELYKLPHDVQKDVLNNTGYTTSLYRAETLENSNYFQVARSPRMADISHELASDTLGYSALTHYYANTPQRLITPDALVPELYQWDSLCFEYNVQGRYMGRHVTNGPLYTRSAPQVGHVEFMKGRVPVNFGVLQGNVGTLTLTDVNEEVVLVGAYFTGITRQSVWSELTPSEQTRVGNTITWSIDQDKKVKVIRLNELNIFERDIALDGGYIQLAITALEDRGTGMLHHPCDVPYLNVSVYLNGHHLSEGIDYKLDFPLITIFSKAYLNHSLPVQRVHVRCSGFTLDKAQINHLDINGFVNNGVLTRNNYYDLRDDRVCSVFIGGRLYDKSLVRFSEDDNTVRIQDPLNGLTYTVRENFIPIRTLSGVDTRALYNLNTQTNTKISALFNVAYPEPSISPFNVINTPHLLFSPVVSKVINDILKGVLPETLYSTPYNDNTILSLLDNEYKALLAADPVRTDFPSTIVTIHPHLGNTVIALNLLQYRFVQNVIRIITNNQPQKVNLSGYIALSS